MKAYKKWSDNTKKTVIDLYFSNTMTMKEICEKYDLSTPVLIYNWVKKYSGGVIMTKKQKIKQNSDEPISFDELTRLAEENRILKEKIKELQDKNLRTETEINLLKKSQDYGTNLRISTIPITLKSKLIITKCYEIVNELKELGYTVKEICKYLPISQTSVSLYKHRKKHAFKINWDPKLILVLKDYLYRNKALNGLENIRLWIKSNYPNIKCSKSSIQFVINLIKLPKIYFDKTLKKQKTIRQTNVHDFRITDKIQQDFSTVRYLNKIGIDGSWIMPKISNRVTKFLLEMAYDFHTTKVLGFHIGRSESADVVKSVVKQIITKTEDKKSNFKSLIQSDCGSANLSKELKDLFSTTDKIEHSFSLAAFKGNQPTECMNRWIKDKFQNMYGNEFETIEKFIASFNEFINWWNNDRICLKIKKSPNLYIQDLAI